MDMSQSDNTAVLSVTDQISQLKSQLLTARNELHKIRKDVRSLKFIHEKDIQKLKSCVLQQKNYQFEGVSTETNFMKENISATPKSDSSSEIQTAVTSTGKQEHLFLQPIGTVKSVFKTKNGIPRQSGLCDASRATLTIEKAVFNNPEHSLEGLQDFSHVWIMFVFHKNNNSCAKAKVRPPRLNGVKVGVFSTRCPYRPNPLGLSLVKLDKITGSTLHLSGVDLLDGTPVIDIKPYIPEYDQPCSVLQEGDVHLTDTNKYTTSDKLLQASVEKKSDKTETEAHCYSNKEVEQITNLELEQYKISEDISDRKNGSLDRVVLPASGSVEIAGWVTNPPIAKLQVRFTTTALEQLSVFKKIIDDHSVIDGDQNRCSLQYTDCVEELQKAIVKILENDPRSIYRRKKCTDRLYYFNVDTAHVTCWFDDVNQVAEVLQVSPIATT